MLALGLSVIFRNYVWHWVCLFVGWVTYVWHWVCLFVCFFVGIMLSIGFVCLSVTLLGGLMFGIAFLCYFLWDLCWALGLSVCWLGDLCLVMVGLFGTSTAD